MVARFVRDVEPYCTFCLTARLPEIERESALHLFYTCPFTEAMFPIFNEITGTDLVIRRLDIFFMFDWPTEKEKFLLFVLSLFFKKFVWDCKLRKSIPNINLMREFLKAEVLTTCMISKKFNGILTGSEFERYFRQENR